MSTTVEQIKERLSIQDVVGSYVKLDRAGKNLKAACPFHNEKTPSFFVSPERGSYYCFGCGAKGDVFTFVEEFEGTDFQGALKLLAERAGVEITYGWSGRGNHREKDRLHEAMESATEFFEKNLIENTAAQAYLSERGVTEKSITDFRLGYARDEWRRLYSRLSQKGFTDGELLTAGLIKRRENGAGYYDTFRGRIMFPISDTSGRPVAFSGRVFPPIPDGEEAVGERAAKYVNNPETPLFHKSRVLYGYDHAKSAMRKYDFCIVVEGQTDVIMSHQTEFKNTVAPLGTALTRDHLESIRRLSNNLILALDADTAGTASAGRGAELALAMGFDVKVAKLPKGSDPADVIKEDPELWRSAIREATHIVEFLMSVVAESAKDVRAFALAVRKTVLPYIGRIDNKIDQAHFVKLVAEKLGVSERSVQTEVEKLARENVSETPHTAPATPDVKHSDRVRRLLVLLIWQKRLDVPELDVPSITKRLLEFTGADSLETLMARYGEEILFAADLETESPVKEVAELLKLLEITHLEDKREKARDKDMKEFQELSKKKDELKRNA
ncbi:DNA primase [Candidatus Wolfebacteria bacterium]|nr:DNA primase [Candidatus Wolfebacteria bacterium]